MSVSQTCLLPMQIKLSEAFDSGNWRRPIGAYGALTSAANRTATPVQTSLVGAARPGHKAKYQITYVPAECDAVIECGESGSGICDTGSYEDVATDVKTIGNCISLKNIQLTTDQFRDLCNYGPSDFMIEQLKGRLDTGMRAINNIILTSLCAGAGSYAEGDTTLRTLNLLSNNNTPQFGALRAVTQVFKRAGADVNPIFIGGDALDMYTYGMGVGGQTAGGSQFREAQYPTFYDDQIGTACAIGGGDTREPILAMLPGVAQMVNYLYNVGEFQSNIDAGKMDLLSMYQNGGVYQKGILQDPITGHMWDISIVYDACTDTYKTNIKTTFDVWIMRLTQCYATDFTGILKYGVCAMPAVECPTPVV